MLVWLHRDFLWSEIRSLLSKKYDNIVVLINMYNRNINNQRQTDFLSVLADIYRFLKQKNLLAKYKQAYDSYFNCMVQGMVKNKNLSRTDFGR